MVGLEGDRVDGHHRMDLTGRRGQEDLVSLEQSLQRADLLRAPATSMTSARVIEARM